jgi:hypothetical protein
MLGSGQRVGDVVDEPVELGLNGGCVGLVVHAVQHRLARRPHRRRLTDIRLAAIASTSPACASEVTSRTPLRPRARRSAKNLFHALPFLGRGHPRAEDLAVPVTVGAGCQQHDRVDDARALADLHGGRVGGDQGERAGLVQRAVSEVVDEQVISPDSARLRRSSCQSGKYVTLRTLGTATSSVPTRAFRSRGGGTHCAGPPVLGTDDGVGIRGQQHVDGPLQQVPHESRAGLGQSVGSTARPRSSTASWAAGCDGLRDGLRAGVRVPGEIH